LDTTPNLGLPYIMAAQSQKHVTHNEALRALDAIVQLSVLDRDLAAPPGSPADGARYIVAASPTGAWTGHSGSIAAYQDGAWAFYAPDEGWVVWIADEDVAVAWNGTAWAGLATGDGSFTTVGVNATADTTNRLAVAAAATLLNHAGAGHQLKINKASAGQTASLLYQTGFSGRAELGLAGDDDFYFKVSPDGSTWKEAIVIDRTSGAVALPFTFAGSNSTADGRLTLESGVPVSTTSQAAKTTVYYTPYVGNRIALYSGSEWAVAAFSEVSASLSGLTANTNYDVFGYNNSGTLALELVAWTNGTTRATVLARQDGVPVKSGATTRRYLGTLRTTGTTGQTEFSFGGIASGGTEAKLYLWNAQNRMDVAAIAGETADSWTYATATVRAANNSTSMRVSFVVGGNVEPVRASYGGGLGTGTAYASLGVGLDSTSAFAGLPGTLAGIGTVGTAFGLYDALSGEGYHYLQALELSSAGTATFYGDNGAPSNCQNGLVFRGKF
jgi:hypothetical protein